MRKLPPVEHLVNLLDAGKITLEEYTELWGEIFNVPTNIINREKQRIGMHR